MRPLLGNPALRPAPEHIQAALAHFREMLAIRNSSPLFRLGTGTRRPAAVRFHNTGPDQIPGLDRLRRHRPAAGATRGSSASWCVINATDEARTLQ